MQIIERLQHISDTTESYFARQLYKEDAERLTRLVVLAETSADEGQYAKDALMIGWTPGDLHTHELSDVVEPLIGAVFKLCKDPENQEKEKAVTEHWNAFDAARRKRLLRCT